MSEQLPLDENLKSNTELVPVQERTLRIYKPFIRCSTCARNLNKERMQFGFYEKTFCNHFGEPRKNQYLADYDIEEDRKLAQHCPFYLPEIGTLPDLTYIEPFEIVNDMFELDKEHAENLKQFFQNKISG